MHLLTRDQEVFERQYPSAMSFLRGAWLRMECYVIARDVEHATATLAQVARLKELLGNVHDCREPWFVVMLRGDGKERVDAILHEVGL